MARRALPEKLCARCGLPFAWRKKWRRDWDSVRYCSERCRREDRASRRGGSACNDSTAGSSGR